MTKNILVAGFLAIGMLPLAARASLITGELNFTGSATITTDSIAFNNGNIFNIGPAGMQQGGFMALGGTTGSIDNITNPPYATGVIFATPDFMTFAAAPNISITLLEVLPGTDGAAGCTGIPAASGQTCTPNTSQFNFQNTSATSSTISFAILGDEVDSLTDTSSLVTGTFTIPLATMNFQDVLALVNAGGSIMAPFSGQIIAAPAAVAVTPEPATLIDMLIGGISGFGLYVSRAGQRIKN
jgi:hypothetical protein